MGRLRARPDRRGDPHARGLGHHRGRRLRRLPAAPGWRQALVDDAGFLGSLAARTFQAFAYMVVLIFVVLFAVSAVKAGYGIFRVVAPDTSAVFALSESAERERGIADIVSGLALAGASWWLLQMHWKLAARGTATTIERSPPCLRRIEQRLRRIRPALEFPASTNPRTHGTSRARVWCLPQRVADLGQQLDLGRAGSAPPASASAGSPPSRSGRARTRRAGSSRPAREERAVADLAHRRCRSSSDASKFG